MYVTSGPVLFYLTSGSIRMLYFTSGPDMMHLTSGPVLMYLISGPFLILYITSGPVLML